VSTESLLPNCRIRCTLALKYDNVEQIGNRQTLQRHPAAARRLDSPNGCREQHVHSNTSLVWIMPKTASKYVEHSSWDALSVATHLVTSDIDAISNLQGNRDTMTECIICKGMTCFCCPCTGVLQVREAAGFMPPLWSLSPRHEL